MDIRVIIFEDNKLVRDALETILNGTNGYTCCGVFPNGDNWERVIHSTNPDVILMDIELPGANGIELTQRIKEKFPAVRILIQTVFNDREKIFKSLCAGASGYILKNDSPLKYLEAITEVYNGGAPMNASVATLVLGFFTNENVILVTPQAGDFSLSDREKEILQMMVQGLNYRTIADKIFISYETVRTHVKHIYRKLHVASRSEAIQKAVQQGLH